MKKLLIIGLLSAGMFSFSSCNNYLDLTPVGKVIPEKASDFRAMMTSAYAKFPEHKSYLSLRSDELELDPTSDEVSALKSIFLWKDANPDVAGTEMPYVQFYADIFYANDVITNAEAKAGSTAEVRQIVGEAYMLRAYCLFELVNIYATPFNANTAATDKGVPMSTTIDIEQPYERQTIEANYNQIFADINKAKDYLNVASFDAGLNYRFTTHTVPALLARIYTYRGEWQKAYDAATACLSINDKLEDLNTGTALLPNNYRSVENIMSLEKVSNSSVNRSTTIASSLTGLYNQTEDKRFGRYFSDNGSGFSSNKGNDSKLIITFRNGEMYLIKAEAAAHLNNLNEAKTALLALESKRLTTAYYTSQASKISGLSQSELISEIMDERGRELALEGHRWYDLRRTTQPQIVHSINAEAATLQKNDPRYTVRFPASATKSNPDLLK